MKELDLKLAHQLALRPAGGGEFQSNGTVAVISTRGRNLSSSQTFPGDFMLQLTAEESDL
jgi:hypothetical protein